MQEKLWCLQKFKNKIDFKICKRSKKSIKNVDAKDMRRRLGEMHIRKRKAASSSRWRGGGAQSKVKTFLHFWPSIERTFTYDIANKKIVLWCLKQALSLVCACTYFLRPFIDGAFVFRKFLCLSFLTNFWSEDFYSQRSAILLAFQRYQQYSYTPSGSIQQQFSFFWCHTISSRIHEKCANCVFLHSVSNCVSLQNILSNRSFIPFYGGANSTNASVNGRRKQ